MTDLDVAGAAARQVVEAFDQLDGPDCNLFFDSTSVGRPFRATLDTGTIDAIYIEWSADKLFRLSEIKLFDESGTVVDMDFALRVNAETFATDLPLEPISDPQLTSTDATCSAVLLAFAPARYHEILIERRQMHQMFPKDFRIFTRSIDGSLTCIFDHGKEAARFFDRLPKKTYLRPFPVVRRQVPAILRLTLGQNYDNTRMPFVRFEKKLGRDALLRVGETMNDRWLFPRDRSFGQHGIKRTFRFWSEQEKADLIAETHVLIGRLNQHDIQSIVCYGSLLGLIRDKDLIRHDDDLDLLCFNIRNHCSRITFLSKLAGICALAGYEVLRIDQKYSSIQIMSPTGCKIDLFYCEVDDDGCRFTPSGPVPTSEATIFPIQKRSFFGKEICVPNKPEVLLEDIYGAGWTVPAPVFRHRWTPTV